MRRARMSAAAVFMLAFAAFAAAAAPAPAVAGYGALARDQGGSGRFGLSWEKPTQREADESAMRDCGASSCRIVFRTIAHQCGAIATADTGDGWGAAKRGQRDAAALAAMNDCQKHTGGQCKVRAAGCNR